MKPLVYKKAKRIRRKPPVRQKLHLTKGDTVQVISGDDKGKQGKIQGVNLVKRHLRASPNAEGGIVEREAPIHHSKAMLLDPSSGEPTRVRRRVDADGTLERIAVKSDQPSPRSR
jgi:large subunit ribosomal protein L24